MKYRRKKARRDAQKARAAARAGARKENLVPTPSVPNEAPKPEPTPPPLVFSERTMVEELVDEE